MRGGSRAFLVLRKNGGASVRSRAASGEAELRAGKGSEIMPARAAGVSAVEGEGRRGAGAGSRGKMKG